jgi:GNAT superfamily N-acetyltransferase
MLQVRRLRSKDAAALETLRQAYAVEMGAPTKPSVAFSRRLLQARGVLVWGAMMDQVLVGFGIVFELPEAVYGATCANLDDLFVAPQWRGQGVARAILGAVAEHGTKATWSHLRWLVPEEDAPAIRLYEKIAAQAPWRSYVMRLDPANSA